MQVAVLGAQPGQVSEALAAYRKTLVSGEPLTAEEQLRLAQMHELAGRLWPELGGQEKYLDVLGLGHPRDHRDAALAASSAA